MQQLQESKSNLVFVSSDKAVTDSLTIAHAFNKGHDKVLRDFRSLKCSESFRLANFGESEYKNKQGRLMPMFTVTFDGFSMLAMGYTGEKAMEFKERYINEFNRTRHFLESRNHEHKLLSLQVDATLIAAEQKEIQQLVSVTVHSLYPRITVGARRKYFARLYQDLKDKFLITSYRDIKRSDYDAAVDFIQNWHSPNLASRKE
ncbi:Rha family transcriptional regulator [Alkalihalobacillus pseudalcaliphilus]|uniref:Rha family transcriptional regulator n=1 Tax=Alkalihalobacillus pseudalcaliphilus TaxID=79884 RepID=UPI00064DE8D4|nr:Rha family transcriptional regulator [Alkalihalobacillus pseudalcaliphilus]KMK77604.1 hypothetical protein AB990_03830 [Alkalihalobacillus pseudalcaliphilus]